MSSSTTESEAAAQRVLAAGRVALLLGCALVVFVFANAIDGPRGSLPDTSALTVASQRPFSGLFGMLVVVQGLLGLVLLLGGLGLRRRREWGRRLLVTTVWIAGAVFAILSAAFGADMLLSTGVSVESTAIVAGAVITTIAWIAILRLALRFLNTPSIRAACS
jgi:hypothetical protein